MEAILLSLGVTVLGGLLLAALPPTLRKLASKIRGLSSESQSQSESPTAASERLIRALREQRYLMIRQRDDIGDQINVLHDQRTKLDTEMDSIRKRLRSLGEETDLSER